MHVVVFDTSAIILLLLALRSKTPRAGIAEAKSAWRRAIRSRSAALVGLVRLELLGGLPQYKSASLLDGLFRQFSIAIPGEAPHDEAVAEGVLRTVNDARPGGRPRGLTGADALIFAAAVRLAESADHGGRFHTVEIVTQDAGFIRAGGYHPRVAITKLPG